jgi:hypothetical protein
MSSFNNNNDKSKMSAYMKEKNSMPSFPSKMPSFMSEKKKEKEKEKPLLEGVDVINWDEAMQQCGDDEEFLRELLGDLRDETDMQMAQMEKIVEVRFVLCCLEDLNE